MKTPGYLIFLFLLTACKDKLPDGILEKEKMQSVYWDLMRADEMVNFYASGDTSYNRDQHLDSLYTSILSIHDISLDQLLQSKAYYETHPELLKPVLDSIFIEGERLQNIPETKETPVQVPIPAEKMIPIDSPVKREGAIIRDE